ncbi:Dual specificity catalytic domain-containing protein [Mycena chlorophos]|uniref:protein-tyrosine-phosphatase n=1 Tax=Mycena chlorophos TaxID=658473 RepID=A0A8H6SXN2_MYCCL|nr:Dual specificity catalytic domain-containing protein [Mycena chlorophos]
MMLSFENIPKDDIEALCTPLHCILPAASASTSTSPGPSTVTTLPSPTPAGPGGPPLPPWRSQPPNASAGIHAQKPGPAQGALFLGSMEAALDGALLRKHRITHLVQVLETPWAPQPESESDADDEEGEEEEWHFQYHRVDIEDRPSAAAALTAHLPEACDYVGRALGRGESVLVHCQQGVSRSPAVLIAFLIRDKRMSYDAAFAFVKQRRSCIKPNAGFVRALRDWERECRAGRQKARAMSEPRPEGL